MIAIFHSGPMLTAEVDPVFWCAFVRLLTGEVVTVLERRLARSFGGALTLDANDAAAERKAGGQRLGLATAYASFFDTTVADGRLEKRGVSGARLCAYFSRFG
jgi:hypothetical protein